MAERKVSVRVSVNGRDVDRELDKMAVEAALVSAALRGIPNRVTVKGDSRGLDQIEQQARRADRSSSALVDTAAAIWPALIPVATLGVPAIAGLAAQFGFAVAGAGTMILAFHGMSDALKALNAYQLDPTVQNLEKAQQALDALGPAGSQFAIELQHLSPVLKQLKQDAGGGLFPGADEGLDSLLTRLPQLQRILRVISGVEGDALAGLGKGIASPELDSFFNYLETDAKPILTDMTATIGHLASGFAHLFVDLAPQERAFSSLLANGARDFDGWANGLDQTQGFQEFMDYVDQTGPEVAHTVAAIATAFLDVAKAGAPLSGVTLHALADLADIIDRIARSPLGTPLIALAGGLALVNRALSVQALAKNSLLADLLYGKLGDNGNRGPALLSRTQTGLQGVATKLRESASAAQTYATTWATAGARTERESARMNAATATLKTNLGGIGKGVGVISTLAFATSGIASRMHLANTATLGLTAAMLGVNPVLGATAGLLLDTSQSGGEVTKTFDDLAKAADGTDLTTLSNQLAAARAQMNGIADSTGVLGSLSTGQKFLGGLLHGDNIANNFSDIERSQAQLDKLRTTYISLAQAIGQPLPPNASLEQVAEFQQRIDPALKATGIDVTKLGNTTYAGLTKAASAVRDYLDQTDSVAGQTAQMQSVLESTTLSASQLASALDSVFSPKLNRAAANDAFIRSLQALKAQLKGTAGLSGTSAGALDNRAAVQSSVQALNAKIKADADAGASSAKLTSELLRGRNAILAQGQAAGISRSDMAAYLRTLGLTPQLVRTIVRLDGADQSNDKSGTLLNKLRALTGIDATPRVDVGVSGVPVLQQVHNLVFGLDGKHAHATVDVTTNARGAVIAAGIVGSVSARGNVFAYARGGADVADRHQPELTRAGGPIRVWSEPETRGEAYIPLANDDRRPRAREIAAETVGLLGGGVMWFAEGGVHRKHKKQPKVTLSPYAAAAAGVSIEQLQAEDAVAEDQAQISDLLSQLNEQKLVGKKGHKHYVYATTGTARAALETQLKVALAQLAQDKAKVANRDYGNDGTSSTSADTTTEDPAVAAQQQAYQTTYDAAYGAGDIFSAGTSASSAVRFVQKTIANIQDFSATIASLRGSGASGLLLKQLIAHAQTGDFAGATKLGKSLLAQPLLLGQLNYSLSTLDQLSSNLGTQLSDPSFATGIGTQIPTMSGTPSAPQVVQVIVGASADQSVFQAQLVSAVAHEVKNQLNGAFS